MRTRRSLPLALAAVVAVTTLTACAEDDPPKAARPSSVPVVIDPAPVTTPPPPESTTGPRSDLSGLTDFGVDVGAPVVIDVAGDGRALFLAVDKSAAVDFSGTNQIDATAMVLRPAAVEAANRVVINAPRWSDELGAGYCVAQAAVPALMVQACRPDDPAQIWHVVPVGDSGQFRLDGRYGTIRVDGARVTPDGTGRTGLQTVPFRRADQRGRAAGSGCPPAPRARPAR